MRNVTLFWKFGETLGRFSNLGLDTLKGRIPLKDKDELCLAHPVDFLASGHWTDYQRQMVEQKIREPFKQVFRELYLPLEEEQEHERQCPQQTSNACCFDKMQAFAQEFAVKCSFGNFEFD